MRNLCLFNILGCFFVLFIVDFCLVIGDKSFERLIMVVSEQVSLEIMSGLVTKKTCCDIMTRKEYRWQVPNKNESTYTHGKK